MKPFLSSRISKLGGLIIFCALSVTTFSNSALADPIRDLQNEVAKRGISPKSVNTAMGTRFPDSDFPYYESANGCSTDIYGIRIPVQWNSAFKDACNNHDRCYATPGRSKNDCDGKFLEEMLRVCATVPSGISTVCQVAGALPYHDAVDRFGGDAYSLAQSKQFAYIKSAYAWLNTLEKIIMFSTNHVVDTGISVESGDRIRIRASGTIRFGLFAGSGGPNGIIIDPTYNYFVDVPHGRLMARFRQPGMGDLEGWSPIGVGWDQVREVELPAPGVLEFLVNDSEPSNNSGEFRIEVTIHSGKQ